ncbi:MBL fold metallo-hydrolase [Rhodopirellula sallentina]|uniref:Metallo-beta-lactamase/rhodanese-like domain-containing protein n=1 Tax=Rhodopirellula sallentina SM41 TaxID=1263870 RepID=M5U8Z5_9BACT|nr:MBL fold hydrolase [Rhodopirellula sallentina]EMI57729.1 metallo-beta-lactamase/rhodanese-like domain-containing protein [Rhodopirellula sallentina SM41]
MTMIFETIQTEGIAQMSYFIGDDSAGCAAVIDPRPNVDVYLELSRRHDVAITHIFETHIHADFLSGARALARRTGNAKICVSGEGEATYGFDAHRICDGERFAFGEVTLTARHTPGHTPEHLSYELSNSEGDQVPWGVLSGDSLFVGSAGRPDLLGEDETEELTRALFDTLQYYYAKLNTGVIIFPCHGAGSGCGADIGDRPTTTIGYERKHNPFLQIDDLEEFKSYVNDGAPPVPQHYPILKKQNGDGPVAFPNVPVVPGIPPQQFHELSRENASGTGQVQIVDTRQMLGFGGGHVPSAINIGDRPEMSVWAGDMLDHDRPVALIVEDATKLDWIVWHFAYVGLTDFAGYLVGGMKAWQNAGLPLETVSQLSVHDLNANLDRYQILDVRSPDEYESGHFPNARHCYVSDMRKGEHHKVGLSKTDPIAVYCGSGYRASIAASILKRDGFQDVSNIPGSMQAWKNAGYRAA